ncbi:MAG: hypothetical protein ACHP7O_07345 [Burkholderiales bacterium]
MLVQLARHLRAHLHRPEVVAWIPLLHSVAKLVLEIADRRGNSIEDIEIYLKEPLAEVTKRNAVKVFQIAIRRAKDEGYESHEVHKRIEKFFATK